MFRITPIVVAVLLGLVMYRFSAWRTARMLDNNSARLRDPVLNGHMENLARELGLPRIPVYVYEVDMVNGLAAPDGRVFLTRGFLDKLKLGKVTAEELVSVVAHELGHVALGHSRRRMIDFASTNALRTILAILLGRYIPFVGVYIANAIAQLIGARLSRKDEFEADAYAAALLTKAGYGITPQVSLFTKLEQLAGSASMPAWFMSHPKTEERIAAIEHLSAGWRNARRDTLVE